MSKKILIVDDDPTFRKALSDTLVSTGYNVVTAEDGDEGLIKAESEKPDLVVLDIMMPKLSGTGFLKVMQEKRGKLPIPVIIASNLSSIDHVSEGVSLGVKGYIIKSNETLENIAITIESIIGGANEESKE